MGNTTLEFHLPILLPPLPPFAISAVLRVFGRRLEKVNLEMTKEQAHAVMESCLARYVREAKLRGSLFEDDVNTWVDGIVSCADTQFRVDHGEPLEALELVKENGISWPFGELPNGHEFLVLVKSEATDHYPEGKNLLDF